ncbi:Gfo/Idh/MocA family protein [Kitasatospora purpeofusca]|uniref:Gfo/Idh/MocA family protein n=1 Tax=Kitasatospora purpeofusca TaxID=67352 RepID=UPI0036D2DFF3
MAEPPSTRYALVGAGTRAWKTYLPLFAHPSPGRSLVGVADSDPRRLAEVAERWSVPVYPTGDVRPMLDDLRPEVLIVTSPDCAHAGQIAAALDAGVHVLTEKPMALTARQAASVVAAERRSRATVRVAHNMRYLNLHRTIRDLLAEGRIGTPTRAHLSYRLRPDHGRSYFLRWHRRAAASGGLQITKSCHHFDLLNWWLADRPQEVTGWTGRLHYHPGPDRGDDERRVPADADIADTVSAVIRYRGGAIAHYSLSARSPWEGYTLTVQGTDGELAARYEVVAAGGARPADRYTVRLSPVDGPPRRITVPRESGTHSGADARMLAALLDGALPDGELPDGGAPPAPGPYGARGPAATAVDGAYAVAVGEAVTRSAAHGGPVAIDGLLPGLVLPEATAGRSV